MIIPYKYRCPRCSYPMIDLEKIWPIIGKRYLYKCPRCFTEVSDKTMESLNKKFTSKTRWEWIIENTSDVFRLMFIVLFGSLFILSIFIVSWLKQ